MMYIHRYWTGPNKPMSSPVAGNIASTFGDLIDWDDAMLPMEIKDVVAEHENKVPLASRNKQRGNIVRLCLLRQFGGTWIDHDLILMEPPDTSKAWVATDGPGLCTAAMHFPQGDPLLDLALSRIIEAKTARYSSGEGMLAYPWRDVFRRPLGWEYDGTKNSYPWAVHLWGSRA